MARIELRNATIRFKDGLSGTAVINNASAPIPTDTVLTITTVALNTDDTDLVPIGARFVVEGESSQQVHVVIDRTPSGSGPTTEITFTPALGAGTYATDEIQELEEHQGGVDGGTFTLTFTLASAETFTTGAINHDEVAANIQSAIDSAATAEPISGWTNGDIVVTGGPLTTTPVVLTFSGNSVADQNHAQTTIDGGSLTNGTAGTPSTTQDGGTIPGDLTFQSQELIIKIGDGDATYTENDEYIYDLDRGELDTVRRGDDQPMEVALNFVYEHITTGTGETIAPMDAIKRRGSASEWVSSADDKCEPYAIDIEITHIPPCGTSETEVTLFPDFRSEQREVSFADANVAVTGRCNAVEPIVSRE